MVIFDSYVVLFYSNGILNGEILHKGIRGAIRYRQWKLHTGIGSKKDEDEKSGWAMAPGRIDGFNAFDDDYEDMTGSYFILMSKFGSQIRFQSINRVINNDSL